MRIAFLAALAVVCGVGAFAQPETAISPQLAHQILGAWVVWNAETNGPATTGLLVITFSRDGKAEWRTCVDGKMVTYTGTYDLEPSENMFFPASVTHVIRLQRDKLPAGAPVLAVLKEPGKPIYLVGVSVGEDNRFPSGEQVLHFHDGFHSTFILRSESNWSTIPRTVQ